MQHIFLYRSKCWTMQKHDEERFLTAEVRWLPKIRGISRLQKIRDEHNEHFARHFLRPSEASIKSDYNSSFTVTFFASTCTELIPICFPFPQCTAVAIMWQIYRVGVEEKHFRRKNLSPDVLAMWQGKTMIV